MTTPRRDAGYMVGPETVVRLSFEAFDEDGQRIEANQPDSEFVFGFGELLPALECAIDGAREGESRVARLAASEAFGARDPARVVEVERSEFPADVRPGDSFEAENPDGELLVLLVLEVGEQSLTVDFNHPLAGQSVDYRLTVESVRPATSDELSAAEQRFVAAQASADQRGNIDLRCLLDGPTERYASDCIAEPPAQQASADRLTKEEETR